VRRQAQALRGFCGEVQLALGPFGALGVLAAHRFGGEGVHRRVIGRMDRDELAL